MNPKTTWKYAEREYRYLAVGLGVGNYLGDYIFSEPNILKAIFVGATCWVVLTCLNKYLNTKHAEKQHDPSA